MKVVCACGCSPGLSQPLLLSSQLLLFQLQLLRQRLGVGHGGQVLALHLLAQQAMIV